MMNGYIKDAAKLLADVVVSFLSAPYLLRKRMPLMDRRHEELVQKVECIQSDAHETKEGVAYIKGQLGLVVKQSHTHDSR